MSSFKIATWNVNSLRVRLPQVLAWLEQAEPDVMALQETKVQNEEFPTDVINAAGYQVIFSGQRSYNGVAILSKKSAVDAVLDLPEWDDPQRRVLAVLVDDIRILNVYVPNGENVGSEKFQYKLNWLSKLDFFLKHELSKHPKMIVLGDFNIAPDELDVYDPKRLEGKILFSQPERNAFQHMLDVGFIDCFRQQHSQEKSFSWWDYRMNGFKRDLGLRIDHILASHSLAAQCIHCDIDKLPRAHERPSDHAPVVAEFNLI